MQAFTWPLRVYYEDTDASGVVYHANYLKYLERGRSEWLRALGLDHQLLLAAHGVALTLTAIEARYRAPARLDDAIVVHTLAETPGAASLRFSQQIWRTQGDEARVLLVEAKATVACVDAANFKPRRWPQSLWQSATFAPKA